MVECSFTNLSLSRFESSCSHLTFAPASSKEFLDIQVTIECEFTLKRVCDLIGTYSLYIPPWLRKRFKFIVLRLLQIHLWVKKLNLFNFTHAAKQNSAPGFDHYPPGRRELSIPPEQHFLKIFFLSIKTGRELFSWQNYQNWQGYWSQVLINSTISATFTFLVYVLLCNNLAANMLKCECSLM